MTRMLGLVVVGVLLLGGCADRLVELPDDRRPAAPVALVDGPLRCPEDTVLLADDDPGSGAGSVPADFSGRTVLRCQVDHTTMRSSGGVDYFTVRQSQGPLKSQLREVLDLPDRGLRPAVGCAASSGGTTAVYLVDPRRRAVRVRVPTDDPCATIRPEVADLLPPNSTSADTVYEVKRPRR